MIGISQKDLARLASPSRRFYVIASQLREFCAIGFSLEGLVQLAFPRVGLAQLVKTSSWVPGAANTSNP